MKMLCGNHTNGLKDAKKESHQYTCCSERSYHFTVTMREWSPILTTVPQTH